mgnify:CR=1 FL=1
MVSLVRDLGFRVGQFAVPTLPAAEIAAVIDILMARHGPDSAAVSPHAEEASVRAEVTRAAPNLAQFAAGLKAALDDSHSGAYVPRLGLDHLDVAKRRFVLYAISLCLGSPTATDQVERRVIWDIKARDESLAPGHVPTYSEHAAEAELHTDTQYFQDPERYLILYFVRPAACGGGVSMLRDGACVREQMARSPEGQWAVDYLYRQELPFRIPTTFTSTGAGDRVEMTFAPIFAQRPGIRYRVDTLRRGLKELPHYDTPDLRRALGLLEAELDNSERRIDHFCQADDFLIIDNHEILHGRSRFSDRERHAIRIRIDDRALVAG